MSKPIVEVTWLDAHASIDTLGDYEVDMAEFHKPLETYSVGYLMRSDKIGVTLVGCVDADAEDGDRPLFIPRGMIVKEKCLRG